MQQSHNHLFTNWARNEQCVAQQFFQPESEHDIIHLLKQCSSEVKRFRTFGSGHSWSPVCLSDDYLMNLDRYQKVIHLDRDKKQVTVQSGIKLWQLNEYLYKEGFSLKNLGSVSAQSLAGAISTATHGSGINFQILASQVDSFKLVTLSGEVLHLQKERDAEMFHLTLVSLGCLGVISELTINIDERYHLEERAELKTFDEVANNVSQWVQEAEHLKFWWLPLTDYVMVYRYSRTQKPVNDSRIRQFLFDEVLAKKVYQLLLWTGNQNPTWRKNINNLIGKNFLKPIHRVEKNWKVFNVPMPPLHRETEWAFDINDTREILHAYRGMINKNNHQVNFMQEIRFVKGDDFALSPCYKRNSVYIGAYHQCNEDWNPFFHDFETLAQQFNGRPHWGKEFTPNKRYLQKQYPKMKKLNELRMKLDPDNLLQNKFTTALF